MKSLGKIALICALGMTIVGCASPKKSKIDEIYSSSTFIKSGKKSNDNKLREKVVRDTALSWGAQEGLYWRTSMLEQMMDELSWELHTVFGFYKFLVDGKVLMPVVHTAERTIEQLTNESVKTTDVKYMIADDAQFVTQIPTWRDYLMVRVDKPVAPQDTLFPKTKGERKAWRKGLDEGWDVGVEQANEIFEQNLRELRAEIEGLYNFRILNAMGIVSMPKYSYSRYETVNLKDGKQLNVNDMVYSITKQSEFTDTDEWQPYFRTHNVHPPESYKDGKKIK